MARTVITARIVGVPAPGVAVWKSVDDPDVVGDLDDAPGDIATDDVVVLAVERHGFRWVVLEVVDHVPTSPATAARPRRKVPRPHAHPARPPGTVLIAWLPFTNEGDDAPGKHRPCIVLRSADPDTLRVRPLYDAGSAHVRRNGGMQLDGWRSAGLDKASVAVDSVEVPVGRCAQTLGSLDPADQAKLGITSR